MIDTLIILIGIFIVLGILSFIYMYNKLVTLKNRTDNAWSQIDVQLKRRADLIPKLVATVRGYAKHERELFEDVAKARAGLVNAQSVTENADANNMLTMSLKSLFAVAENYPDLKANQNFLQLQQELSVTENKIAYARQFYNDMVMRLNTATEQVPTKIIATQFKFEKRDYFEIADSDAADVKINLG